ncbi:Octanoyltransferase [Ewingella americana]|uniref:Octanoyltransferase n=1 Tax=Ewingella americana TaxID=41202 RepID=A0A377NFV8_9GAMM|nr:Octanoyltransferase [Ewingella americana]
MIWISKPFLRINPCGYAGLEMTQVSREKPGLTVDDVMPVLVKSFNNLLNYQQVDYLPWQAEDY